jgi:hypothetical protein
MARNPAGTATNKLTSATTPITALPLTMACWANPANVTTYYTLMAVLRTAAGTDSYAILGINGAGVGDPVIAEYTNGSTYASASTTAGYSANTWQHFCAVFSATNSRAVYLNGGSAGTNTTNVASAAAWTGMQLGGYADGDGNFDSVNGPIAHCALWNVAFTAAEVANLPLTRHDQYRIDALVGFWELWGIDSPEPDSKPRVATTTAYPMTIAGTVIQTNHCPVVNYSLRYWKAGRPFASAPAPPGGSAVFNAAWCNNTNRLVRGAM